MDGNIIMESEVKEKMLEMHNGTKNNSVLHSSQCLKIKELYLYASNIHQVSRLLFCCFYNTCNKHNCHSNRRYVLPAENPEKEWATASHVFNIITQPKTNRKGKYKKIKTEK